MAPTKDAGDVTRPSNRHLLKEEDDTVDDYALAAIILAVILICVIIAVVIYSCCQRRLVTRTGWRSMLHCSCPCPCSKASGGRRRREDLTMGYFPANITVNSAAVEQGVPDIFMRADSSQGGDGRISLEPYSFDNSGSPKVDDDSPTDETSGAWSEFLRRVTLTRRGTGTAGCVEGHTAPTEDRHVPGVSSERGPRQGASQQAKDVHGITNPLAGHLSVDDESAPNVRPRAGGQDDVTS